MKKYLTIIVLLISLKGLACDCALKTLSDWQKSELENSEFIFIGDVIEVNDSDWTFKIKVTEPLVGGDSIGNIYVGKNWKYCSPYVHEKGKWIVYGTMEEGFLRLNICGISRSFSNPVVNLLPPPPELKGKRTTEKKREEIYENLLAENLKIGLSDLELEIGALRKIRDKK